MAKRLVLVSAVVDAYGMLDVERPLTFKTPKIVVEPFTKSDVVVPFWRLKLRPVMNPVLVILKSVEVAKVAVVDAIVKTLPYAGVPVAWVTSERRP